MYSHALSKRHQFKKLAACHIWHWKGCHAFRTPSWTDLAIQNAERHDVDARIKRLEKAHIKDCILAGHFIPGAGLFVMRSPSHSQGAAQKVGFRPSLSLSSARGHSGLRRCCEKGYHLLQKMQRLQHPHLRLPLTRKQLQHLRSDVWSSAVISSVTSFSSSYQSLFATQIAVQNAFSTTSAKPEQNLSLHPGLSALPACS